MIRVSLAVCLIAFVEASAAATAGNVTLSYQVHDPRWSPSGNQLAYIITHGQVNNGFANPRWRARIWLVDATGHSAHPLTPPQFAVQNLAWSPDGSAIAYNAGGHLWRTDLRGHIGQLTFGGADDSWWPAWSPDGQTIAYTRGHRFEEGIYRITALGGTPTKVVDTHERPAWSPDGTRLLVQGTPAFVNPDGTGFTDAPGCATSGWSADGKLLVGALCAFDVAAGAARPGWHTAASIRPQSATLSPDDTTFAFTGGFSGRVFLLTQAGALNKLPDGDSASEGPAWSANGHVAYIARGRCGRHSEIRVADEHGLHTHPLFRAC